MFLDEFCLRCFPNNKQNNYILCFSDMLMSTSFQQGTCTVQVVKR